jgi:hypothetical protein
LTNLADYQAQRDAIAQTYQSLSQSFDPQSFTPIYLRKYINEEYAYELIEPQPFIDYDPPQEEAIAQSRNTGVVNRIRINGLSSKYQRGDLEGFDLVLGESPEEGEVYQIESLELNSQRTTWTVTLIQKTTEQSYQLY